MTRSGTEATSRAARYSGCSLKRVLSSRVLASSGARQRGIHGRRRRGTKTHPCRPAQTRAPTGGSTWSRGSGRRAWWDGRVSARTGRASEQWRWQEEREFGGSTQGRYRVYINGSAPARDASSTAPSRSASTAIRTQLGYTEHRLDSTGRRDVTDGQTDRQTDRHSRGDARIHRPTLRKSLAQGWAVLSRVRLHR